MVSESLESIDTAVSICNVFYLEVNTQISRGCVNGMVTDRIFLSWNPMFSDLLLFHKSEGK